MAEDRKRGMTCAVKLEQGQLKWMHVYVVNKDIYSCRQIQIRRWKDVSKMREGEGEGEGDKLFKSEGEAV